MRRNHWKTKHENPTDEVMHILGDEDIDKEIEDPERIKSTSDALQAMDKVKQVSHQFENKDLYESIADAIKSLPDLRILRRRQTKITTFFTKNQIVM